MLNKLIFPIAPGLLSDSKKNGKTHTVSGTLGGWPLASSTSDTDTVDNVTLLGLVAETAGLIGARGAGSTVDNVELTELY